MPRALRKKLQISEPWKNYRSDDEIAPRGAKRCALNAAARLGPFKTASHAASNEASETSRAAALDYIENLARSFNYSELVGGSAPRAKDVINKLEEIKSLSSKLAETLRKLDDVTRIELAGAGLSTLFVTTPFHNDRDLEVAELPQPSLSTQDKEGRWIVRLNALSKYAEHTARSFQRRQAGKADKFIDKGGNTNIYKKTVGSSRLELVRDGLAVFEKFKPGKAKGTEGGEFHSFLMDVFEYATGLEPEVNSKLIFWVKKLPKVRRRLKEIETVKAAIISKYMNLIQSPGGKETPKHKKLKGQIAVLNKEATQLEQQLNGR